MKLHEIEISLYKNFISKIHLHFYFLFFHLEYGYNSKDGVDRYPPPPPLFQPNLTKFLLETWGKPGSKINPFHWILATFPSNFNSNAIMQTINDRALIHVFC